MSGRNSRVVRNRDRSEDWNLNNAKIIVGLVAVILVIIVAVIIVVRNARNGKSANIANLDRNIPYEYFLLSADENLGVIDKNGNEVIEPKYSGIEILNQSKDVFICYSEDGQAEILNKDGKEIFDEYDQVEAIFSSTENAEMEKFVLKYKKDDLYGLIDLDGNVITEAVYSEISSLNYRPRKHFSEKRWKIRNCGFIGKHSN